MTLVNAPTNRQREVLDNLLIKRGLEPGDYALFWVTGEGRYLPSEEWQDIEETSGFVVDREGRVFMFWLGWDSEEQCPRFVEWTETQPEPNWREDEEYREAREVLGLSAA